MGHRSAVLLLLFLGASLLHGLDSTTKLKPGWTIGICILEDKCEKLQQVIAATGEIQAPHRQSRG